jgi:hypothetical protein
LDRRAPFHKDKNSIGDAVLIETFIEVASGANAEEPYAFVTHNKHDFSNMGVDEREPHPDLSEAFASKHSSYSLALGDVLSKYAPEWMDDVTWQFEFREEPRLLSEIMEAEHLLYRQVWYNRHWNLRIQIEKGKHKLVTREEWDKQPPKRHQKMTIDTVWAMALSAAKRTEDEVGPECLGPWSDFEWGMINGKLSALQQAFSDAHALQCGYCTPGMLMSATALLRSNPTPSEAEIKKALQGNICRCTGYWNIIEAVQAAAKEVPAS